MTWLVGTCVRPLFVFFDVEPEAYKLQIRYLINYVRTEVREIRTMILMHDIYIYTEDQERPSGRWITAPQWWVIDNGCWTDSWRSAQV
jgi:hypothetical protein